MFTRQEFLTSNVGLTHHYTQCPGGGGGGGRTGSKCHVTNYKNSSQLKTAVLCCYAVISSFLAASTALTLSCM